MGWSYTVCTHFMHVSHFRKTSCMFYTLENRIKTEIKWKTLLIKDQNV